MLESADIWHLEKVFKTLSLINFQTLNGRSPSVILIPIDPELDTRLALASEILLIREAFLIFGHDKPWFGHKLHFISIVVFRIFLVFVDVLVVNSQVISSLKMMNDRRSIRRIRNRFDQR